MNAAATVPSQKAEHHIQAAGVVFCPAPIALTLPTVKVNAPKRKAALRFIPVRFIPVFHLAKNTHDAPQGTAKGQGGTARFAPR